jgi:hypothetical protein
VFAVLEPISDTYLFALCIGLFALLAAPLARVEGGEDALTKFLIKRSRGFRKPRPARLLPAAAGVRERPRKPRADRRPAPIRRRKQSAVAAAKKAALARKAS